MVEAERVRIAHERLAHAGEQKPHERVDIGVGAHGGAGILRRLFLVYHYGDGQALYAVHMRTAVLGKVLLHERGEGVVELPAALCRDGVKHQRALAGARHPRENRYLVSWYVQRDVLQVVLPGPADPYRFHSCKDRHFRR